MVCHRVMTVGVGAHAWERVVDDRRARGRAGDLVLKKLHEEVIMWLREETGLLEEVMMMGISGGS